MVSSAVEMEEPELRKALRRIKREHGDAKEYKDWRELFPKEWPM